MDLDELKARLSATTTVLAVGRVRAVTGLSLRAALPGARIGDVVVIRRKGEPLQGEIVGFEEGEAIVLPLGGLAGVGPDDPVESTGAPLEVRASDALLGRVVDGLGRPLDGGGPLDSGLQSRSTAHRPPRLGRRAVSRPLAHRGAGDRCACSPWARASESAYLPAPGSANRLCSAPSRVGPRPMWWW